MDGSAAPAGSRENDKNSQVAPAISQTKEKSDTSNGIAAALARAVTRGVAVYFSRPVRLFRPSKVTGWTMLRGSALRDNSALTPQYVLQLIRSQGFLVIPRHFIPPLAVNTILGAVLWESYGYSASHIEKVVPNHPIIIAASSGAIAGGCQSIAAAPAENVRLILEGHAKDPVHALLTKPEHSAHSGWLNAWKQVFQGNEPVAHASTREEVRELNKWISEVKGMAGRGWDGWAWGCSKDMCGFALFFSLFELSRKVATEVAYLSVDELERLKASLPNARPPSDRTRTSTARIAQGVTLVAGGVIAGLGYEMVCRPFDHARRAVYLDDMHRGAEQQGVSGSSSSSTAAGTRRVISPSRARIVTGILLQKLKTDGPLSFFVNPQLATHVQDTATQGSSRGIYALLRTLARVGPWGAGFLIFEAMGGSLPQV
ncbi:hypothetical protein FRC17_007290 [Serendipita sp. 399]|nr:hypothetical protein FRC17_007290 [Serendipita sp. 399]